MGTNTSLSLHTVLTTVSLSVSSAQSMEVTYE